MGIFWRYCYEYSRFYADGIIAFWKNLRPASYASVLAFVWLVGFVLLKSAAKKHSTRSLRAAMRTFRSVGRARRTKIFVLSVPRRYPIFWTASRTVFRQSSMSEIGF